MNYRRHGVRALGAKALGLSVLVGLGLMVFATTGAKPEIAREWLVNGQSFVALSMTKESILGEIPGTGEGSEPVAFLVAELNIEVFCKGGSLSGEITTAGQGEVLISLSKCFLATRSPLEILEMCTIPNIHLEAKVLSRLHGGTVYVLLEPKEGAFGFIKATGEECVLPEEMPLTGTLAFTLGPEAVNQLATHVSETVELLLETELLYGGFKARAHADATVFLSGKPSIGKKWRVH